MYSYDYDTLAQQLSKQLNQTEALIYFTVPGSSEHRLKYPDFYSEHSLVTYFAIEWVINIKGQVLTGTYHLPYLHVAGFTTDITDSILKEIVDIIIPSPSD